MLSDVFFLFFYNLNLDFKIIRERLKKNLKKKMHEALTSTEDFLVGSFILVCGLIGLVMNVKLISKLKARSKSNPNEKTNKLYVNLIFCDLGIILLAYPLPATASLLRK